MSKASFEVEGGEICVEDAVFQLVDGIGMVRVIVPDDTEGEKYAQDDAQGRQ